jgi:hypothetical protein
MGLTSWAKFSRPCGTKFAIGRFSLRLFSPTYSQSMYGPTFSPNSVEHDSNRILILDPDSGEQRAR